MQNKNNTSKRQFIVHLSGSNETMYINPKYIVCAIQDHKRSVVYCNTGDSYTINEKICTVYEMLNNKFHCIKVHTQSANETVILPSKNIVTVSTTVCSDNDQKKRYKSVITVDDGMFGNIMVNETVSQIEKMLDNNDIE